MSNYICTITQVTIHCEGDNPLSTPEATVVNLDDDGMGGGCFLSIKKRGYDADNCVLLDPAELPKLQEAAQLLLNQPAINSNDTDTLLEVECWTSSTPGA